MYICIYKHNMHPYQPARRSRRGAQVQCCCSRRWRWLKRQSGADDRHTPEEAMRCLWPKDIIEPPSRTSISQVWVACTYSRSCILWYSILLFCLCIWHPHAPLPPPSHCTDGLSPAGSSILCISDNVGATILETHENHQNDRYESILHTISFLFIIDRRYSM